jgi:hypothetical protein
MKNLNAYVIGVPFVLNLKNIPLQVQAVYKKVPNTISLNPAVLTAG